jgi:hypothetical protein
MKTLICWTLAGVVVISGLSRAQSAERKDAGPGAAKEQLVGAWRLAWLDEPEADGKMKHITDAKGSLIYTPDGHMSVAGDVQEGGVCSIQQSCDVRPRRVRGVLRALRRE